MHTRTTGKIFLKVHIIWYGKDKGFQTRGRGGWVGGETQNWFVVH